MKTSTSSALGTLSLLAVIIATAAPTWPQGKVGVVTTVIGPVTVARTSMPPEPLKFKDDVFVSDRVTTGDDAITRILLGGKVIITARERSTLTITEIPGLSTIHLTSGRIAVAVDKTRMNPGERVDVRTPNAVAGVRGTVLIVEAQPNTSTITVLRGLVHVTRLDAVTGHAVGAFTAVGARQAVSVRNNVLPARPQAITPGRAHDLSHEFTPPLKAITSATVVPPADDLKHVTDQAKLEIPAPAVHVNKPGHGGKGNTAPRGELVPGVATAAPTLVTAPVGPVSPTVATAPLKANVPNRGASPLNRSSAKRLTP